MGFKLKNFRRFHLKLADNNGFYPHLSYRQDDDIHPPSIKYPFVFSQF